MVFVIFLVDLICNEDSRMVYFMIVMTVILFLNMTIDETAAGYFLRTDG